VAIVSPPSSISSPTSSLTSFLSQTCQQHCQQNYPLHIIEACGPQEKIFHHANIDKIDSTTAQRAHFFLSKTKKKCDQPPCSLLQEQQQN
jgi:hypothetical protein